MVKSYTFSQNTLFLLVAYIFEKILVFFYFIFLARYFGPREFGIYSFVNSFIGIFFVFIDLGFSTVLIREIAKNREKAKEYLENALAFKIITSLIVSLIVIVVINLLGYSSLTRYFVYLLIFYMIFESFGSTFYSFFRGLYNLRYEAISFILSKGTYVLLGIIFILLKLPFILFAIPIIIGGVLSFLYPFIKAKKYLTFGLSLSRQTITFFFQIALPIVFSIIFSTVFGTINTVLVSYLSSDRSTGLFSAAFRIPMALLFLPAAVGASIFPVFSSLAKENKERLAVIFEKVLFYMIFLSFPIIFGGWAMGNKVIAFIYGSEFLEATLPFKIMISVSFFLFLDFLFSSLLTALNKQKENAISRGIGLAMNILLCFILIPGLTHLGGAIAFAVGFTLFSLIQLFLIFKLIPIHLLHITKKAILVLISCSIMSLLIYLIKDRVHFFISLSVGIISYAACLYLTGGIKKEDIKEMRGLVKSSLKKEEKVIIEERLEE